MFLSHSYFSQTNDLGSWNIINLKYYIDKKWSVFAEAQLRSLNFYTDFHYYEIKGGFNFMANKNILMTLGAGSYQTYKEGGNFVLPKNNDELRVWPQVILFQEIASIKIEQRYRLEMRWTSSGFRDRFRYRIGVAYPFGKEMNGYKPFQTSATYELFLTNTEPYFERARIQFLLNYKTSKNVTLQMGYLHQFDYQINDETGRDFIVVGFYYELFHRLSLIEDAKNELNDN
jgi:plasmid maintenance system killer protein